MRVLPATLLVAATGCAQIFGLDVTSSPDADPSRVSLTMSRWSVGAAISKNPLDMSKETAQFLVDDGTMFTPFAAELRTVDTWSAPIPTGTPAVKFSLPDLPKPYTRLWMQPARDRRGVFIAFEHPSPQPPLPNSTIQVMATLPSPYASNESFQVQAIGAWMARGIVTADGLPDPITNPTTFNVTLPYSSFTQMSASPKARITSLDTVVLLRYVANKLTGVYQSPPFDQSDGMDTIMASMLAVQPIKTLSAVAMPSVYGQRFSAVRPAVSGQGQSWLLTAAPGWSIGQTAGPRLDAATIAATDTSFTAMYGNPFESLDWRAMFSVASGTSRTHMFMDTIAMTLGATMQTIAEPTGTITIDFPAGLPINIRANQTPLSTDGMMLPLDLSKPVEVDAILDKPGATLYVVTLVECTPNSDATAVDRTIVVDALVTGEPKVRFPPDMFKVGSWYYLNFNVINGGFVNAASGDMQMYTLPSSASRADSAVFQVVMP